MNLLIVDDERYIVNYLFALIEEHIEIDLNIQKAYSGSEALEILSISKIDLMLLDIHMPGYSGLELAGKVSAIRQTKSQELAAAYYLSDCL